MFVLSEYILRKDLGASRWHILAFMMIPMLAQMSSLRWTVSSIPGPIGRRPFLFVASPIRFGLLLLLVPALRTPTAVVLVLAAVVLFDVLLIPIQNGVVAAIYPIERRGRVFGWVGACHGLGIMAVSRPAGRFLDAHPGSWPWLYTGAMAAGVVGLLLWATLHHRAEARRLALPPPPTISPWRTLLEDRNFLAFEACFMVYGLAFLALQPVIPLYLVDEVGVTYGQAGTLRGLVFWTAFLTGSLAFGRLSDRIGVLRSTALAFGCLALFPTLLLASGDWPDLVVAFAVYGVAMGGVHIGWNLGPLAIAGDRDTVPFMRAHIALVGVRSLFGMVGGASLHALAGSRPVFAVAIVFEVVAAVGLLFAARRSGSVWRVGS